MKLFTNRDIKRLFLAIAAVMAVFLTLSQLIVWIFYQGFSLWLLLLALFTAGSIFSVCLWYFRRQNAIMEAAVAEINSCLAGNASARIECDSEGELYKLFHAVNTLAAVLSAHAENELRAKDFLKNTIADISHQLKTPLAALNIYNGLLQDETENIPAIQEFVRLSEGELDRIETLVQSLLKITKLDAGSIVLEKAPQNISDMMNDIALHFAYRTEQEQKEIVLSGADGPTLLCDRDWMMEAISNLTKNALDHTGTGGHILIEWKQLADLMQIVIKDNGSGIHPEDMHHIFKRFYRSRFSKDTQGIGLGLPLAKAIVEAHDGSIAVDSVLGEGCTFVISFLNPTKL